MILVIIKSVLDSQSFLEKYGYRIQYSLFEIRNSKRLLNIIKLEIEGRFAKKFGQSDSIIVFDLSAQCYITKYGYAKNEDSDLVVL